MYVHKAEAKFFFKLQFIFQLHVLVGERKWGMQEGVDYI